MMCTFVYVRNAMHELDLSQVDSGQLIRCTVGPKEPTKTVHPVSIPPNGWLQWKNPIKMDDLWMVIMEKSHQNVKMDDFYGVPPF